jgi:hypothetical protein
MPEAMIRYFGHAAKVACDGNCKKAWGVNTRPREQLSENEFVFLADGELGEAPEDPGTYEGFQGKPKSSEGFPNKWCVRECERCSISRLGESEKPLEIRSYSERVYNIAE